NAIQIGLYGLFGAIFGEFMDTKFSIDMDWWIWALVAWGGVRILCILRLHLSAPVVAVLLILECLAVAIFDVVALQHPADGAVTVDGILPANLFTAGFGAVLAFGIASF